MSYGDTKAGKVKYIADGEELDGLKQVIITVAKSNDVEKYGNGTLIVKGEPELDHFLVTVIPDTVVHSNTADVSIIPMNQNNEEVSFPDTSCLNISLDANGELYGTLLAGDGTMGKSLLSIPYFYVKESKLKYIADGENPIGCCPPKIVIEASKTDDSSKSGSDSAWVHCKLEYTHFSQGDSSWGGNDYDTFIDTIIVQDGNQDTIYHKIRKKGCALTCMAMVLKASGVNTDPGILNEWMIENDGFSGPSVLWKKINKYPRNDNLRFYNIVGKGLEFGNTISYSTIDTCLQKCYYLIAQVKNPDTNRNHWIIIKAKENGSYDIVDPGKGRTTLDAFGNNVYRMTIYSKKN
jgi:hypothetical protein